MREVLLIIYFIFFLSAKSFADNCTPVRLDGKAGPLEHVPVMDQDSKWICYAYGSSQMIDAYRFSHGDKNFEHLTSPVAASVFYSAQRTDFNAKDIEYGWQHHAISSILENGSCNYRYIFDKFGQKGLKEYFEGLSDQFNDFRSLARSREVAEKIKVEQAQKLQCYMIGHDVPSEVIPEIENVLSALLKPSYLDFLEELFTDSCKSHLLKLKIKPKLNIERSKDFGRSERTQKIITSFNSILGKENPQPVGINFCEDILWNKNIAGVGSNGEIDWGSCTSYHTALVVGRRSNAITKKCEFLVRNAYGDSCNTYPDWDCENGQIWVTDEKLANNMVFYSWLE